MQRCGIRTAIPGRDLHQNVAGLRLRVFDEYIEVAILGEDAGIEELVFRQVRAAPGVLLHQIRIGKRPLRIFVEHLQIRMRGGGIQIEVMLLDVLAVIALRIGQSEQALLQNRIAPVPQCQRQAHALFGIRESRDAVLAPAIGAAARVIVREVFPGGAARAVILADGAPLAFAQIRTPVLPALGSGDLGEQSLALDVHVLCSLRLDGHALEIFPGA